MVAPVQPSLPTNSYLLAVTARESSALVWSGVVSRFAIAHSFSRGRSWFGIHAMNESWQTLKAEGAMSSLEEVLLRSVQTWKIPLLSWHLHQPPEGVALYATPRRPSDKADRAVRKRLLNILSHYQLAESLGAA